MRNLKYEEVYIKGYSDGHEAWQGIRSYFQHYNTVRPNKNLGGKTPADILFGKMKISPILL